MPRTTESIANQPSSPSTATPTTPPPSPSAPLARTRRWAARIGAVALIGLGTAHTITNAIGFAATSGGAWPVFLLFGPGLGVLLAVIGVLSWRQANRTTTRWPVRVVLTLAGLFCLVAVVNVVRLHPTMIWVPAGPGPWATVGTPALLLTALLPSSARADREFAASASGDR